MERLGSAKWLEIIERFRDLKKVEKHLSNSMAIILCFVHYAFALQWF